MAEATVSQTKFLRYGESGFWAYDVAHDVFLKYLIDAAVAREQTDSEWLSRTISDWRVACIQDFALDLDTGWSAEQTQTFLGLADEACARIEERESIPANEIVSWKVLDDVRLH